MTTEARNKVVRNIVIYYGGALLLAIAGGVLMASGQEIGGLLFVLSPLVMVLVVRFLLGDGWKDAGLRLNLRTEWRWYVLALLLYPLLFGGALLINVGLGFTTLTVPLSELWPLLLAGFVAQLIPRMLFSVSEEWGWRGYLEPRLQMLGLTAVPRHIVVGLLWGVWHFPLILGSDYTTVPLPIFLPLFSAGDRLPGHHLRPDARGQRQRVAAGAGAWDGQCAGVCLAERRFAGVQQRTGRQHHSRHADDYGAVRPGSTGAAAPPPPGRSRRTC